MVAFIVRLLLSVAVVMVPAYAACESSSMTSKTEAKVVTLYVGGEGRDDCNVTPTAGYFQYFAVDYNCGDGILCEQLSQVTCNETGFVEKFYDDRNSDRTCKSLKREKLYAFNTCIRDTTLWNDGSLKRAVMAVKCETMCCEGLRAYIPAYQGTCESSRCKPGSCSSPQPRATPASCKTTASNAASSVASSTSATNIGGSTALMLLSSILASLEGLRN